MTLATILALSWLPASAILAILIARAIPPSPRPHHDRQQRSLQGDGEGEGNLNHWKEHT